MKQLSVQVQGLITYLSHKTLPYKKPVLIA